MRTSWHSILAKLTGRNRDEVRGIMHVVYFPVLVLLEGEV